jgi:hypothetical protein
MGRGQGLEELDPVSSHQMAAFLVFRNKTESTNGKRTLNQQLSIRTDWHAACVIGNDNYDDSGGPCMTARESASTLPNPLLSRLLKRLAG